MKTFLVLICAFTFIKLRICDKPSLNNIIFQNFDVRENFLSCYNKGYDNKAKVIFNF